MAYSICNVKNISGEEIVVHGKTLAVDEIYKIPDVNRVAWATDDTVLVDITDDIIQIGNSCEYFTSYSDQIDWLKGY
jgi:hypothetical protein